MFVLNNANGVKEMCGVGWTYIHLLMHIHILTKCKTRDGVTGLHRLGHTEVHICAQLCQGGWSRCRESGSHAYMY